MPEEQPKPEAHKFYNILSGKQSKEEPPQDDLHAPSAVTDPVYCDWPQPDTYHSTDHGSGGLAPEACLEDLGTFYVETALCGHGTAMQLVEAMFGKSRILFGTDFPGG